MRKFCTLWACLLLLALPSIAQKNEPKASEPKASEPKTGETFTRVLNLSVTAMEFRFMPAVDAMPEDKYDFAPTKGEFSGVRTFAQQVKHVAASNYIYAAAITGEKPPEDAAGENGPDKLKTKAEIVQYLRGSFTAVHSAIATINTANAVAPIQSPFGQGSATRLAMVMLIVGHCNDHYGQMVEYLRMNGIVPPASQR